MILSIPYQLINYINIKYRGVVYTSYPEIRGFLILGGRGQLEFGRNVKINSSNWSNPVGAANNTSFHVAPQATIKIGSNVGISNSVFYSWTSITIEDDVMIGGGCQLYDTDFHSIRYEDRVKSGDNKVKSRPVVVKQGAFIGACTIILKGVTIGERSVVAAGSVVVKNIPPDEVWGGNPCRFIKKIKK